MNIRRRIAVAAATFMVLALPGAQAQEKQENYASWPPLQSTFRIDRRQRHHDQGLRPGDHCATRCVTTFMAVDARRPIVNVYFNVIEFEATSVQGGTLCANGKWRAMDGSATGNRHRSECSSLDGLVPARAAVKRCYRGMP